MGAVCADEPRRATVELQPGEVRVGEEGPPDLPRLGDPHEFVTLTDGAYHRAAADEESGGAVVIDGRVGGATKASPKAAQSSPNR